MSWSWVATGAWACHAALGGGLLLLLAWVLMGRTSQPARQQQLGQWAVVAALLLAALSVAPAWLLVPVPWQELPLPATEAPATTAEQRPADTGAQQPSGEPGPQLSAPHRSSELVAAARLGEQQGEALSRQRLFSVVPSVLGWLGFVYLSVASVLLGYWLLGHVALWRLLYHAEPAPESVARLFAAVLPDRRRPRLLVSRRLHIPVSCGLFRPTVVLPAALCTETEALRWVFAHEMTHLERRDPWCCLLFGLAQVVYFYLPWFWWLRRQVGLCQEFIADASVASRESAPEDYAQFLLALTASPPGPTGALAMAGQPSDLSRRVKMLLLAPMPVEKQCPRSWAWACAAGLVILAVFLSGVGLRARAAAVSVLPEPSAAPAELLPRPQATAPQVPEPAPTLPTPERKPADSSPPAASDRSSSAPLEARNAPSDPEQRLPTEGRLGARVVPPSEALADQLDLPRGRGVVLVEVLPNSPAARAGLRPHDVLLALDGQPVSSDVQQLARLVATIPAGTPVEAVVLHKGRRETIPGLVLPSVSTSRRVSFRPERVSEPAPWSQGALVTVDRLGERFLIWCHDGPTLVAVLGTFTMDQPQVEEILVHQDGNLYRYHSLDRVPASFRSQVQQLLQARTPNRERRNEPVGSCGRERSL